MKSSKKILALILAGLMSVSILVSCGGDGNGADTKSNDTAATEPSGGGDETTPAETEPVAFDSSGITSNTFGVANPSLIAYLSFDGSNATLNLLVNGEDKSVSGACTIDEENMTIGDKTFAYKFVASYLTLQEGETKYQLTKAADSTKDAEYKGAYALMTNSWSGDGASLSFADGKAKLKLDAAGIDYSGTYSLDSTTSLTVKDSDAGNPANLALDCTTYESGCENDSYISPLAVDGDYTTRFASAYEDPSFITIDLGAKKTVGAVILYWEAACGKEYNIEVSTDNENWTAVVEERANSTSGTADAPVAVPYSFDPVEAQYVRMYGISRNLEYGYSLFEFEVYEKLIGEANVTLSYSGDNVTVTYDGASYTLSK